MYICIYEYMNMHIHINLYVCISVVIEIFDNRQLCELVIQFLDLVPSGLMLRHQEIHRTDNKEEGIHKLREEKDKLESINLQLKHIWMNGNLFQIYLPQCLLYRSNTEAGTLLIGLNL